MNQTLTQRVFGLDLMRCIAILFVVCSHALWAFPEAVGSAVSLLRLCGVMGVEIFFVLSGFLIGRILFRIFTNPDFRVGQLKYFLVRRWFRTLPNYYLILLVNIALWMFFGRELPNTLLHYFGFLQNFNFGMDIFFTESWSLPIEEFAYILGPLLFYLVLLPSWKLSKQTLFLGVTLMIIIFFIGTKVYYNMQTGATTLDYWNIHLKAVLLYRIDAIYYGVLAAYLSMVFPKRWKQSTSFSFVLGVLCFVGLHVYIGMKAVSPNSHPFLINVVYLPICSMCIALSLPFFSRLKRVPVLLSKPVTFISVVSYSMYLLHYSIILVMLRYWFPSEEFSGITQWAFAVGYVLLTVFLSYLLYRFYEKPMMDIRDLNYFRRIEGRK